MKNMIKQIFIIRTAPYDYQIEGMSLYESFNAVAKRKIEVSINSKAAGYFDRKLSSKIVNISSVYCSPRTRSIETAKFVSQDPQIFNELIEVKFRMEDFISEKDFFDKQGKPKVQKARKFFVFALINDNLEESYQEVMQRIELLIDKIKKDKSNKVLIFSHGFYMKIIEAYIRDNSIKSNPKKLLNYFDGSIETFKFCEGFILDQKNGKLVFNAYISDEEAKNDIRK